MLEKMIYACEVPRKIHLVEDRNAGCIGRRQKYEKLFLSLSVVTGMPDYQHVSTFSPQVSAPPVPGLRLPVKMSLAAPTVGQLSDNRPIVTSVPRDTTPSTPGPCWPDMMTPAAPVMTRSLDTQRVSLPVSQHWAPLAPRLDPTLQMRNAAPDAAREPDYLRFSSLAPRVFTQSPSALGMDWPAHQPTLVPTQTSGLVSLPLQTQFVATSWHQTPAPDLCTATPPSVLQEIQHATPRQPPTEAPDQATLHSFYARTGPRGATSRADVESLRRTTPPVSACIVGTTLGTNNTISRPEDFILPTSHDSAQAEHLVTQTGGDSGSSTDGSMKDYVDYLARRDLVSRKIALFDDRPEKFATWRASFRNMIKGVPLSSEEQLQLMAQHMVDGSEAKVLVERLARVCISRPDEGLKLAWTRLQERFGSAEAVTQSMFSKLERLPKLSGYDYKGLQKFSDVIEEFEAAKGDGSLPGLGALDTSHFMKPVVAKLPNDLIDKWKTEAFRLKEKNDAVYPTFSEFASFVRRMARIRNDSSLMVETTARSTSTVVRHTSPKESRSGVGANRYPTVKVIKTDVGSDAFGGRRPDSSFMRAHESDQTTHNRTWDPLQYCPIHRLRHSVDRCRIFRAKPLQTRLELLKRWNICTKCAISMDHTATRCTEDICCSICNSTRHCTALHCEPTRQPSGIPVGGKKSSQEQRRVAQGHGEESRKVASDGKGIGVRQRHGEDSQVVVSKCTDSRCQIGPTNKSCSKICKAKVYKVSDPTNVLIIYAVLDDQSNRSLGRSELFDYFGVPDYPVPYELRTCAGVTTVHGRRIGDLLIESLDGTERRRLPRLTECNSIPCDRSEIPTPEIARLYEHTQPIADQLPELDPNAAILLLIGRDCPDLLKVRESRNGPSGAPWAQRTDLGWVMVGDLCVGDGLHKPDRVNAYVTHTLPSGRPSVCAPCPNRIRVKEILPERQCHVYSTAESFVGGEYKDGIGSDVYRRTKDDDRPANSIDDNRFLEIMEDGFVKNSKGNWVAPLPLRVNADLPNNRTEVLRRFKSLSRQLERKPVMLKQYSEYMENLVRLGHAEPVGAESGEQGPRWYLPHFAVFNPRKPDKIRIVFDSSAIYRGTSLNKALLQGPDLLNSLFGILLRFREEPVAFMADVEHMFHCFYVREDHRDLLRFFWFRENDPSKGVAEFRMNVHVFGNASSPAVASFGLRKTAVTGAKYFGSDVRDLVLRNFYVDDGLKSTSTSSQAVDLLQRTRDMLATANMRLHKIASNSAEVMNAFPETERAKELQCLDPSSDSLPVQRSLGVSWDLKSDGIVFAVPGIDRPFTRRGVLSTTNSIYDPIGFSAPVVVKGKVLLRQMTAHSDQDKGIGWDDPLPEVYRRSWDDWCRALNALSDVRVSRAYCPYPMSENIRREIHAFGDASSEALGACCYLRMVRSNGDVTVSFVAGKAKLAPSSATTIPRLELCAAVLVVELTDVVIDQLDIAIDSVTYYTDSKAVLGYLNNDSRRFYVYVANRVQRVRKSSDPSQWQYIATEDNPADAATRSFSAKKLNDSSWLRGPSILWQKDLPVLTPAPSVNLDRDPEVRPTVCATRLACTLGLERFERFSTWNGAVTGVAALMRLAQACKARRRPSDKTIADDKALVLREKAATFIINEVQRVSLASEIQKLKDGNSVDKSSPTFALNPLLDENGTMRVGGRLDKADLSSKERHPVVLPKNSHLTTLIVRHFHSTVRHQGRHYTSGAIRHNGFWILGGKRLISSVLNKCVTCRKLRGKQSQQQMASLPPERLEPSPPFTHVGVDVWGPWQVLTRKTRGASACSKRWALLFTCMSSRGIHLEILEDMTTSTFINAFRRFLAIRGPVETLFSDRGSNFTGACNTFDDALKEMDKEVVDKYLRDNKLVWKFNPPHASSMGGVWERAIGMSRRILDAILLESKTTLTHDLLATFMAEVSAIVNSRPLLPVSTDPDCPEILTPSALLTGKPSPLPPPPGIFDRPTDIFGRQWRRVRIWLASFGRLTLI